MKLKDVRNKNPNESLPQIAFDEIEIIWVSGYWDGIMDGLVEYKGELFWLENIQANVNWKEGEWYRRFAIVQLSKEQLKKQLEIHKDFQRFVGTHWDSKQLKSPPKFEEEKSKLFYDKHSEYIKSNPFEENRVIGWTEN